MAFVAGYSNGADNCSESSPTWDSAIPAAGSTQLHTFVSVHVWQFDVSNTTLLLCSEADLVLPMKLNSLQHHREAVLCA